MEPIYFMKDVRATPEMIQAMNEGITGRSHLLEDIYCSLKTL